MTFGKWNNTGSASWVDQTKLQSDDLMNTLLVAPPIGAVIAWDKSRSGTPPPLPLGWTECDGRTISDSDSPLNGVTLPNLNAGVYLYGSTTANSTGGVASHTHSTNTSSSYKHINTYGGDPDASYSDHTHTMPTDSVEPPYYNVVYIIRIK